MNTSTQQRKELDRKNLLCISGGSPSADTSFGYDIAYILAYGYAALISYIGSHAMDYGVAFK